MQCQKHANFIMWFLIKKSKNSKNHKNVIFSRFYRKLSVTQTLTLHYEIDNWLHSHAAFKMNFPVKIPRSLLVMNECITSKKKHPKLYKGQHFFGFQLARGAPVWQRAVNRQPGSRSITCRAGAPPSMFSSKFSRFSKISKFPSKIWTFRNHWTR